jgi:hypothetical protein
MPRTVTRKRTRTTANGTKVVTTSTASAPDLEWRLQAEAVRRLRARPDYAASAVMPGAFTLAGDFNAARRSPREATIAKATGIAAGDPDLRIYASHGRLLMIELKAEKGKVSEEQIDRHALLIGLGYVVVTIHATTPEECADLVEATVEEWLAAGVGGAANDNAPLAACA